VTGEFQLKKGRKPKLIQLKDSKKSYRSTPNSPQILKNMDRRRKSNRSIQISKFKKLTQKIKLMPKKASHLLSPALNHDIQLITPPRSPTSHKTPVTQAMVPIPKILTN
jgi:hypothetical protein